MSSPDEKKIRELRSILKKRVVTLADGSIVPVLGQGTWFMGENAHAKEKEIKALHLV
jgi:diketogulonate reductase-like aldo/keto reductase